MKRIVMLTNDINQFGGIETVISTLCSFFVNRDMSVTILSLYSDKPYRKVSKVDSKLEIIHLGVSNNKIDKTKLIEFFSNYMFDILITFHPTIALTVSRIIRHFPRILWIATEHSDPSFYTWKRILLNVYAYRRAHKLVVPNNNIKEYYSKFCLNNIEVIPNTISFQTDQFAKYNNKRIIAVGRIENVKRFDRIVKAFQMIEDQFPEWELEIVGSGTQLEYLKSLAEESDSDQIHFLGYRTDIKELMLASSFLAVSSATESFCLAALEGMECGLPVVATDLPSVREINNQNNAVLFSQQDDINQFSKNMKLLMKNEKLICEMGKNAKQCAKRYHPDQVCEKWIQLFELK